VSKTILIFIIVAVLVNLFGVIFVLNRGSLLDNNSDNINESQTPNKKLLISETV
jgi:hypothetical protein